MKMKHTRYIYTCIHIFTYKHTYTSVQVTILLYDADFGGLSEYLGCAQFNLRDSYCPGDEPKKDPIWLPFFFEEPGDGEGEVCIYVCTHMWHNNGHIHIRSINLHK